MKATVTYIFCFSILLISCNVINFGSGDLATDLELKEKEITTVQDIKGVFIVRNKTKESIKYEFLTGCQVGFKVLSEERVLFNSEKNQICTEALTSFTLKPKEIKSLKLLGRFDNTELKTGNYAIKAYLIGYEDEVYATKSFSVN